MQDRATIPQATPEEITELERIANLPEDKFESYINQILAQQARDDKRTARQRMLLICIALAVAWMMGAACAAHTIAQS